VLVLHGLGGSGARVERVTSGRFDALADRAGAVVAYRKRLGALAAGATVGVRTGPPTPSPTISRSSRR
jgi:poly(3-hydroxybutyrate) depolymerase